MVKIRGAGGDSNLIKENLSVGMLYSLSEIAQMLDVQMTALQRRGVFHKAGSDAFVIFVTLDEGPYSNALNKKASILFWEGQRNNREAEKWFAEGKVFCHVFAHDVIKTPYVYYGRAFPIRFHLSEPGIPSKFVLYLPDYDEEKRMKSEDMAEIPYVVSIVETEKKSIQKIRIGQDEYRKSVVQLWHGKCAVTGVDETSWLIASHIKPWRESNDKEKFDPRNSLLLTPDYDKLFDLGVISFSPDNGKIILPENASFRFWKNLHKLGIDDQKSLSDVPSGTDGYLDYHNHRIFGFKQFDNLDSETIIENLVSERKLSFSG